MELEEILSAYKSAFEIITLLQQLNKDRDKIIEDFTAANKEAKMVADTLGNELNYISIGKI